MSKPQRDSSKELFESLKPRFIKAYMEVNGYKPPAEIKYANGGVYIANHNKVEVNTFAEDTKSLEDEAQVLKKEKEKYPYVGSMSISKVKNSDINVPDCMRVNIEVVDKWLVVGDITLEDFAKMITGSRVNIKMLMSDVKMH